MCQAHGVLQVSPELIHLPGLHDMFQLVLPLILQVVVFFLPWRRV